MDLAILKKSIERKEIDAWVCLEGKKLSLAVRGDQDVAENRRINPLTTNKVNDGIFFSCGSI